MSTIPRYIACAALLSLALPAGLRGQVDDALYLEPPSFEMFFFGDLAVPIGEFQNHVDLGGGAGLGGILYLGAERLAAVRVEGTFVVYGQETLQTPLSRTVPFVEVDVTTTNSIVSAAAGPQVFLSRGPIRPYLFGTVGLSYFVTETGVSGVSDDYDFASTTNFDDLSLALTGGGGLSVRLRRGEAPVSLDLSVAYHHNGLTEYLTRGDLRELPGGGWTVSPVVSDANLVTYRVGVSLGIPRKPG